LSIATLLQGWAARHKRASIRTIALRVVPVLFSLVAAAVSLRAAAQAFSSNDAARGWIFLGVAILDLLLVVFIVALGRAFADRAKPIRRGTSH
jgi:protein-S-isoprenylcysteine O-methyltransferase Ste14